MGLRKIPLLHICIWHFGIVRLLSVPRGSVRDSNDGNHIPSEIESNEHLSSVGVKRFLFRRRFNFKLEANGNCDLQAI